MNLVKMNNSSFNNYKKTHFRLFKLLYNNRITKRLLKRYILSDGWIIKNKIKQLCR